MTEEKRNVPKLRFKGFTDDWIQDKLGETSKINPSGQLPKTIKYVDLESVSGTKLESYKTLDLNVAPSRAKRLAKKGDIFYQTVRPYQKNNYYFNKNENNFVFSSGYAQIRPINVDNKFLFNKLHDDVFVNEVLKRCTGTSYPAVSSKDLSKIKIFSPKKKEQNKIGNLFDKLNNIITLEQEKLDLINSYKNDYITYLFANVYGSPRLRFKGFKNRWEKKQLSEVGKFYSGGTPTSINKEYYDGEIPFVRSAEIDKTMTEIYITEKGIENS